MRDQVQHARLSGFTSRRFCKAIATHAFEHVIQGARASADEKRVARGALVATARMFRVDSLQERHSFSQEWILRRRVTPGTLFGTLAPKGF